MNRVLQLLSARKRLPPRRRIEVKDSGLAVYADDTAALTAVDEGQMSATFTITTMGQDREGDVVVPEGCRDHIDQFNRNPRVFWNHQAPPGLPIGSARDQAGNIALRIVPGDRIISTCFFHGKTELSDQVYALVVARELEAASIGFLPLEADHVDSPVFDPTGHKKSFYISKWILTEWSIVGVGANQDAIAARLGKGLIEGRPICQDVRTVLENLTRTKQVWSNGFMATKTAKKPTATKVKAKEKTPSLPAAESATPTQTEPATKADQSTGDLQSVTIPLSVCPTEDDARQWLLTHDLSDEQLVMDQDDSAWLAQQFDAAECDGEKEQVQLEGEVTGTACVRKAQPPVPNGEMAQKGQGKMKTALPRWLKFLTRGKSALQDCVSEKIPKLLDEGYDQDQAAAIAYKMCGEDGKGIKMDPAAMNEGTGDSTVKPADEGKMLPGHKYIRALKAVMDEHGEKQEHPEVQKMHVKMDELLRKFAGGAYPDEDFGFAKAEKPEKPEGPDAEAIEKQAEEDEEEKCKSLEILQEAKVLAEHFRKRILGKVD